MQFLRQPIVYLVFTIISLILESIVEFDEFFQQIFFQNGSWSISAEFHANYKWLLYTGIKVCIIIFTIGLFLFSIYCIYSKKERLREWIKPSFVVVVSIAVIPLIVSLLKSYTGIYAPRELMLYGGNKEHVGFLMQIWKYGYIAGGRCFPAGHASGGFALMSLCLLPFSSRNHKMFFLLGLILGWFMGLYQMARGEHFISHTLFTMFLALFVISMLNKYVLKRPKLF